MPMSIETILTEISHLSYFQQKLLYDRFSDMISGHITVSEALLAQKKNDGYRCPHCNGKAVKNGRNAAQHQVYRCKECGKHFTANTNTPLKRTRKSSATWRRFLEGMLQGLTLSQLSASCGISMTTAFRWRHKVFDAIVEVNNSTVLSDTIEADETFFLDSFKGRHKAWPTGRQPRRRGGTAKLRGISHEQICIPCLLDSNGNYAARITNRGKINASTLSKAFGERIGPRSVIVSDSASSYRRFSKSVEAELHQIQRGKYSVGEYNIQEINSLHNNIALAMNHIHRGVATKYANGYVAFACWKQTHKGSLPELVDQLIKDIVQAQNTQDSAKLSDRPAVPLVK